MALRKYILGIMIVFLTLSSARADDTIGRGYGKADYRTLTETYFGFYNGGNPDVDMIDNYAKLVYCELYKEYFSDDFEWEKIRSSIKKDIRNYHSNLQRYFEITGKVMIDRYDFEANAFPVLPESRLNNIGKLAIYEPDSFFSYCGESGLPEFLPASYNLILRNPFSVNKIPLPPEKAQEIVRFIATNEDGQRIIYVRYRMELMDFAGLEGQLRKAANVRGQIQSIDLFLDPALTRKFGSLPVTRKE